MTQTGPSSSSATRPTFLRRAASFLKAHPILCLALLTPGIPEYLSGSSSPIGLLIAPPLFGLFLLANLGLYTAGVLLIREAKIRWNLGWASVLLLGLAYGIAEEGLALVTLFNPHAGPINPASAGHVLGVNWIWTSQILPFHALFSIALPLFLFELALPSLRGRPLLSPRGLRVTAALYLATIAILGVGLAVGQYWMGVPVLVGSLLAIGGLVGLARALPKDAFTFRPGPPRASPTALFGLGASTFPLVGLVALIPPYLGVPLVFSVLVAPAFAAGILYALLRTVGTEAAEPGWIAFAAGLLVPIAAFGFLFALRLPIGLPLVLGTDAVAFLFLRYLYRRYAPSPPTTRPAGRPVAA